MKSVQLTLAKGVYTDPGKLQQALQLVQKTGHFVKLDTRYASRIGVVSGVLPEAYVAEVEMLDVVSALQRDEKMRAFR